MPESGRSQPSIINLANHLIDWTMTEHPVPEARDALSPPYIEPTPENDPQPNPSDDPSGIKLISKKFSPDEEVNEVVKSIEAWLPDHKDSTVAVLTSTNDHAAKVAEALKQTQDRISRITTQHIADACRGWRIELCAGLSRRAR